MNRDGHKVEDGSRSIGSRGEEEDGWGWEKFPRELTGSYLALGCYSAGVVKERAFR